MIEIDGIAFDLNLGLRTAIITDDIVGPLHAHKLKGDVFTFPHGEKNKTRATKEYLENLMFEKGLGRDTCVIALGGGVVTDMAGYIAATYCRGLPLIMIPTSLLAMVDASIGGKNGVNVPYGKNMLGCIYQPQKIIIDLDFLKTLPKREFANGMVEMIKHGLIGHFDYFVALEKGMDLKEAILESCRIKQRIVEEDEEDKGKRHLLNFGHTVGHALEHLSHYSLSHGEAVAIGILVESYIALQLGAISQGLLERIKACLLKYSLPLNPPQVPIEAILSTMALDKKSIKGKPSFVIIGKEPCCLPVEDVFIRKALHWMRDDLCCH